jgi:hypothetical protein
VQERVSSDFFRAISDALKRQILTSLSAQEKRPYNRSTSVPAAGTSQLFVPLLLTGEIYLFGGICKNPQHDGHVSTVSLLVQQYRC